MVTWIPVSSPFVRFADRFVLFSVISQRPHEYRFVDPALGFTAAINFFVFQAFLIPYEIGRCPL